MSKELGAEISGEDALGTHVHIAVPRSLPNALLHGDTWVGHPVDGEVAGDTLDIGKAMITATDG
ncbi:hypothetical protein ACFYT4_00195 [Streptomyces sp. NPDC004609]|uniref:hypothetical protein n=1 Tax=Streptomyces sp. NPDC004609 TaxID=3364704 RepID=UPI003678599A